MRDERVIIAEQFAEDYLLVVDNDREMYQAHLDKAKNYPIMATLSDKYREGYDNLIAQVSDLIEREISEEASLLIRQIAGNAGSLAFDLIARNYLVKAKEEQVSA